MLKLKAISMVFLLLAVFLFAGTVMASDPPPSEAEDLNDPEVQEALAIRYVAGETLTDEEEAAAIRYVTIVSVETVVSVVDIDPPDDVDSDTAADSNLSCKGQTVTLKHKNWARITQWTFISDTEWCYDGTHIVGDPTWTVEGRPKTYLGWHYRGNKNSSESGGDGETSHHDYVQGHFEFCVIRVGCTQSHYPTIEKWQYEDGTHRYKAKK
ncbi:MAG: hypothetical protein F4X66_20045 [Chloroflexi bacterium]|nr:hypothetical protein [Chloroflexota bacterium]